MSKSYETILVEKRDAVTLITINRPQALNALSSHVLADLIDAFASYDADPSQRCAVLTGSGEKAFAAGADIKEMSEKAASDFFLEDFFAGWTSRVAATPQVMPALVQSAFTGFPGQNGVPRTVDITIEPKTETVEVKSPPKAR